VKTCWSEPFIFRFAFTLSEDRSDDCRRNIAPDNYALRKTSISTRAKPDGMPVAELSLMA
jgi:hypothetical protein